jgi:DNA-binding beta-propeller fold protein YncE
VFRIDPATNRVTRRIRIGGSPGGLAISRSAVWVGNFVQPSIARVSPASNRVVKRVRVGEKPVWLAAKGYTVFASVQGSRAVARVDERRNRRVRLIRGTGVQPVDGGIVAGDLWVPNLRGNSLTRIDIKRNRVKETVRVGPGPFVVPDDPSELWVASYMGDDVWRMRPR